VHRSACRVIQPTHPSAEDLVRLFGEGHEMVAMGALAGVPKDLAMLTGFASTDVYV
jgi:hypothetical protein